MRSRRSPLPRDRIQFVESARGMTLMPAVAAVAAEPVAEAGALADGDAPGRTVSTAVEASVRTAVDGFQSLDRTLLTWSEPPLQW